MGQQQLLLLVLGIVIVGLSVVIGIAAFSENRVKSSADAMVTDGMRIASDAQAWALKPVQAGGGGSADALSSLADLFLGGSGFQKLGYPTDASGLYYANANGTYVFAPAGVGCAVTIPSGKDPLLYIISSNEILVGEETIRGNFEVGICLGIAGTNPDDIGTSIQYAGSEEVTL